MLNVRFTGHQGVEERAPAEEEVMWFPHPSRIVKCSVLGMATGALIAGVANLLGLDGWEYFFADLLFDALIGVLVGLLIGISLSLVIRRK